MTVVLVGRDLLFGSRIAAAAERAGRQFLRVNEPAQLPAAASVKLALVDWAERGPSWGEQLAAWCAGPAARERPNLVIFGPHTDLVAHSEARAAGLGPMLARSKLVAALTDLFA